MSRIINFYRDRKVNNIRMGNAIIRATNYKTFRALESSDFIVANTQLSPYIIQALNLMYNQHPSIWHTAQETDNNLYKCDIVKSIVKQYNKFDDKIKQQYF